MSEHEWSASAAPYALDALAPDERAAFEAHLAECAACRADVQAFREVAGLLAQAAPAAAPPAHPAPAPGLRDRVLAEARRVRPIGRRRGAWVPWLAAAASLLIALAAAFGFWRERTRRGDAERAWIGAQLAVAARDSLLATLLTPDLGTATLAATGKPPTARLFWNRARHVVVAAVFDLPPAPAGRTYQLWGIETGKAPRSLGTFNTASDGRATLTLSVPADLKLNVSAVTEEPAGGSPHPTQTPFLVGPWQGSQ